MCIFDEEGGQPFKHPWELSIVCGPSPCLDQGLGRLGLDPQERWMCVCGGGRGEMAPSFPWKLEEDLPKKMNENLHFYTKSPLFILRETKFGP